MNANEISPKANSRLNRIQKVSRYIRLFLLYGIPIVVVCQLASMVFSMQKFWADYHLNHTSSDAAAVAQFGERLKTHRTAIGLEEVLLLLVYLFWYRTALKLFGCFERGILFTAETVRCIQILGAIYIMKFLVEVLFFFSIGFFREGFGVGLNSLFIGLPFIFLGWLIDEARKIREEQELTV